MSIDLIVPFFFGAYLTMIIDILWGKVNYKKIEKGLEWHEHYHISLELLILGIFINMYNPHISSFLFGMSLLFFIAEWRQSVDTMSGKVKIGHPFAIGSTHVKFSSIIGITLTVIAIISYLYLPTVL